MAAFKQHAALNFWRGQELRGDQAEADGMGQFGKLSSLDDLPPDAELDGRMAGFAAVVENELDGLFVEPDLWRHGIGSALIEAATHQARRDGLALRVIASPTAREFYESCGFSVEGEAATRFGPALRMSR